MRSAFRLLWTLLYTGYLVHVGLLMIILPWSTSWPLLLVRLPPRLAMALDEPALRGAVAGFGALHLLLVVVELVAAHRREAT